MRGRDLAVGALLGAVIASAVGVAYAAIPDGGGVVHACYQTVTSATKPVKLLDTAKATACPTGWKPVTWNQKGVNGTNGTSIDARLRSSAAVQVQPTDSQGELVYTTVPMTPSSWSQAANEVQQPSFGQVDFTSPATCNVLGSGEQAAKLFITASIDGQGVAATVLTGAGGGTHTRQLVGAGQYLFEPGALVTHTLTVAVAENCNGATEHITVNSVALDVAGMR